MTSRTGGTISLSCIFVIHDLIALIYIVVEKLVIPQEIVIVV